MKKLAARQAAGGALRTADRSVYKQIGGFLAATFALGWLLPGALLMTAPYLGLTVDLSLYSPVYYLGVWSPALAALVVSAATGGRRELLEFIARVLRWRCAASWYLAAIALVPVLYLAAAGVAWWLGLDGFGLPASASSFWMAVVLTATAGPIEEIGWRGYALPRLQRRLSGLASALVLGGIWAIWHLPVFLVGGFDPLTFVVFCTQILAISIIVTVFFNGTGGCVPLMMLMHWLTNFPYPWEGAADLMAPQAVVLAVCAGLFVAAFGRRYLGARNLVDR